MRLELAMFTCPRTLHYSTWSGPMDIKALSNGTLSLDGIARPSQLYEGVMHHYISGARRSPRDLRRCHIRKYTPATLVH